MTLTPAEFQTFGGIDLDTDPEESGASRAIDLVDVDFDREGRVCARWGYTLTKSLTMTAPQGFAAFATTSGTRQFVVGYTNGSTKKYEAYATSGGSAVASASPSTGLMSTARIGTTSNEYLYIANGTDTLWRWTGSAFSQPSGLPAATHLAVMPRSNRLVAGGITGTSLSRVEFSDPGAPETFGANNFVELMPGDGSPITGLATWQDYVFAFKRDRHFVFSGESVDSTGNPIFNYRTVDTYGAIVPPVSGKEGVYFFDGRTIYVTAGGEPRRISRPIEPFLADRTSINGEFVASFTHSTMRLSYSLGRLYVSFTENINSTRHVLVYDPRVDAWTLYSTHLYFAADLQSDETTDPFTYWLADTGVAQFAPGTYSTDNGTPFSWFWKSGWFELAEGRTAVTQESSISGSGTITLRVATDYGSLDTGSAVVISSPGVLASGWQQIDREGRRWQHQVSGTGAGGAGAFVDSVTHFVSFVKPAGIE